MKTNIESFCIGPKARLQDIILKMNENCEGIVVVTDEQRRILGTVTDGDVRRAVLRKTDLETSVDVLLEQKKGTAHAIPLTAPEGRRRDDYLKLLKKNRLLHLPILNEKQQVVGLVTTNEFIADSIASMHAVVMAGGKGNRLMPLTEDVPKPMLPVGEKPMLEIIIDRLRSAGIRKVNVTTHHCADKIKEYFGDGGNFGVHISYVSEESPLGTAGSLGLLDTPQQTLLVINGDVLTNVDFRSVLQFHQENKADLTVAVRTYDIGIPYGIVECEGVYVKKIQDMPKISLTVNAGIYLLEPVAHQSIPKGKKYHMTDLVGCLLKAGRRVVGFPIHEAWLDVGRHSEYLKAQEETWVSEVAG